MKPKSVTTQIKALDEYFLMVVFTLLLNMLMALQILCLILTEKHDSERFNLVLPDIVQHCTCYIDVSSFQVNQICLIFLDFSHAIFSTTATNTIHLDRLLKCLGCSTQRWFHVFTFLFSSIINVTPFHTDWVCNGNVQHLV